MWFFSDRLSREYLEQRLADHMLTMPRNFHGLNRLDSCYLKAKMLAAMEIGALMVKLDKKEALGIDNLKITKIGEISFQMELKDSSLI